MVKIEWEQTRLIHIQNFQATSGRKFVNRLFFGCYLIFFFHVKLMLEIRLQSDSYAFEGYTYSEAFQNDI